MTYNQKVRYYEGGIVKFGTFKAIWKSAIGVEFARIDTGYEVKDVVVSNIF